MKLFTQRTVSETKHDLECSEEQAFKNLEKEARRLLRYARWHPFDSKIVSLHKPLLQLRLSRRLKK